MAQNTDPVTTTDDPTVIARDIRETRSDMSETVDALAQKLDPEHLKTQATDALSGAAHDMIDKAKEAFTGGSSADGGPSMMDSMMDQVRGSSALDAIKENPLPALAVGVSLAWFVSKLGESEQERYRDARYRETGDPYFAPRSRGYLDAAYQSYPDYRGGADPRGYGEPARIGAAGGMSTGSGSDESLADKASDAFDTAKGKASDLADQAKDAVSGAVDSAKDAAGNAADAVTGTAGSMGDDASHRAHDARRSAAQMERRAVSWMDRHMQQSPLLVGAVSLAAGALVGLSLPESDMEDDLMGAQARKVREKAKQQALSAADAAQAPLADAAGTVADKAKTAADDVAKTAKKKAAEVTKTAKGKVGDVADKAANEAQAAKQTAKAATKSKTTGSKAATVTTQSKSFKKKP